MTATVFAETTDRWQVIHQQNTTYGQYTDYLDLQTIEYDSKTDTAYYWIKNEFQRSPNAPKVRILPWMKAKDIQRAQQKQRINLKHYSLDFKNKTTTVIGYVEDFNSLHRQESPWPGGEGTVNPLTPGSDSYYYPIVKAICTKVGRPQLFQESPEQWKHIYSSNEYEFYIDTLNITRDKSSHTVAGYVKKQGKNSSYYIPFVCNFDNKTIKNNIESNSYTEMHSIVPDTPDEAAFNALYAICKSKKIIK